MKKLVQPDLMYFPMAWGGSRPGSGRKAAREKTVVVRIPAELLKLVTEIKDLQSRGYLISVTSINRRGAC